MTHSTRAAQNWRPVLFSTVLAVVPVATDAAQENRFEPAMRDYLETEILDWVFDPAVIAAIAAQNRGHAGMTQDRIDALDAEWRADVSGQGTSALVTGVLQNPTSGLLREMVRESGGMISEVFIMDRYGLNVAASGATSDYWQGDEPKFQETYGRGAGSIHLGEVEFDESVKGYVGQVSVTVADLKTGELVGAMTVALRADMLY